MTGNAIDNFLDGKEDTADIATVAPTAEVTAPPFDADMERVQVAMSLCLLIGIIQVSNSKVRLDV